MFCQSITVPYFMDCCNYLTWAVYLQLYTDIAIKNKLCTNYKRKFSITCSHSLFKRWLAQQFRSLPFFSVWLIKLALSLFCRLFNRHFKLCTISVWRSTQLSNDCIAFQLMLWIFSITSSTNNANNLNRFLNSV